MLEPEILKMRSDFLQTIRAFFINRGYIEADTPAMSPAVIPDTSHEYFSATYIDPWTDEEKKVFLGTSHEYFLKKVIAATRKPVFQLSKCYRNCESAGRLNSPEFTQLEFYTPAVSYEDAALLTEALLISLPAAGHSPFLKLSMEEAFRQYAGFSLTECRTSGQLAEKVRALGIPEFSDNPFDDWPMDELFELILSQCVEPALPEDRGIFLMDSPFYVHNLAKEKTAVRKKDTFWKECWTLYLAGTKIAVSRSEETDARKIKAYLERESRIYQIAARVKGSADMDFWKTFKDFPECAGVELNVDRLIMLLAGKNSIESVIPFPFRLKTGYY